MADAGTEPARARRQRLGSLFAAARLSPLYRERLGRGGEAPELASVPPVTKRELMQRFDEWVTDPALTLHRLRAFIADPSAIGRPFDGRYVVWESSGSSGEPAIFVQDEQAMAVYDALEALRRPALVPWRWLDPWLVHERMAFVGATDGHFASTVSVQRLRLLHPAMASRLRGFSFLQPTAALVEQLNGYAPTILVTYPTAALLLAEEAAAGRLRIAPREVWTGGETLTAGVRRFVEHQFGCAVSNSYGASEFLALASQCKLGALHLNSDWAILEPVDERGRPVPPGVPGCTTLLTNLANHVQPVIRYDLGDRVVLHAQRCTCGSRLPVIEVEGRSDDMLVLHNAGGEAVRLLPLALTTVLEDDAGLYDFQLVQHGDCALRLTVREGQADDAPRRGREALATFLRSQGLPAVQIDAEHGPARVRGRSGKLQRIVAGA
jgi:phenylacetate-coenzyme A ligase PaaK-like adenylate-forming protein